MNRYESQYIEEIEKQQRESMTEETWHRFVFAAGFFCFLFALCFAALVRQRMRETRSAFLGPTRNRPRRI
ncbi:MAG: hypothetical protein LC650_01325 [Actinobacteria bacterium]|nr:hypothetical protein [Actinomycetota bacterium]